MPTTLELVRSSPAVARVVFHDEKGIHILSLAVLEQMQEILDGLASDPAVRVLVFEAQGRTFLAGAELRELQTLEQKTARRYSRTGQKLFQEISELPFVTISAMHAACVGGGLELSLACSLRLAAASAKVGFPEVRLGIIPGWGGTARTTQLLGPAVAQRVILTGELLPATEALHYGLVDAVFPDGEFRAGVDRAIAEFLAGAPRAVARAKDLIAEFSARDLHKLLRREAEQFAACYATGEPAQGIAAFLDKQPAPWAAPALPGGNAS